MIYTHSHVDHFGGVRGVVDAGRGAHPGKVKVIAPDGFMEHAIAENVYAGTAMSPRRLHVRHCAARGPQGPVGAGLGLTPPSVRRPDLADGATSARPARWSPIDGVEIEFQMAPDTEAPSEMHFYFPKHGAVHGRERHPHAAQRPHPARGGGARPAGLGAVPHRDDRPLPRPPEVAFASHHWPTWTARRRRVPRDQRDLYGFLHDQTLRLVTRATRRRDRRDDPAAAGTRERLEPARLLRLGEPQREGDLPALPRLVRRQPGAPVGAPAGGAGEALRRGDGGHDGVVELAPHGL